jgi:NhaA family Na+:H+ antiporter
MITRGINEFLKLESAGGILLCAAALLAIAIMNSPLAPLYSALLDIPIQVRIGALDVHKPLLLWINDGLMALFFLLVGLELKRELLEGELSTPARAVLPVIAALGGMVVPALIYICINRANPVSLSGWAIPTATDIAFALGVLALFGSRVPAALKLFLLMLAVIDDLGAVVIIAVFYSADLSAAAMGFGLFFLACIALLNRRGVTTLTPYILFGVLLWTSVLKSGVHATLSGVVLAMFIPLRARDPDAPSPLRKLEEDLHPAVAFAVLPLFAFANAGVSLSGISVAQLTAGVPLGIALGLFVGKQAGVFGASWLAVRLGVAALPEGVNWMQVYGIALLAGIGFTMSLFIGSLAFQHGGMIYESDVRLGILAGSGMSAVAGWLVLRRALNR